MAKRARRSATKKRSAVRPVGQPAGTGGLTYGQDAEVVDRNEYLVRLIRSERVEVKIFATDSDTAQELAANGLGEVTEKTLLVSETRSISQIG